MVMRVSVAALLIASAAPAFAASTVLKVWTISWSPKAHAAFDAMVKDYEAAHPDVEVKDESRGTDEHKTAMRVAASSGQGPDIYYMWSGLGLGGEFVEAGASVPLDEYYAKYKWDDRFTPAAISDSKRFGQGRNGVPFVIHGEGLYYNKALFAKAGITEPPKTYDELVADADKLKAAKIPAIVFGGSVNWHLMRLMDVILEAKCGAAKHDALMSMKADWSSEPCATASFVELKKWADTYTLKPFMGLADDQAQNLFYAGRAAMALEGDWFVDMIGQHGDPDKFGLFLFPTGTDRLYFFSEYFYVSSKSANKDAAADFLNFITSPAEQQKVLGTFSAISVTKGLDYSVDKTALGKTWRDIFAKTTETFANGDQAFPIDVTTEYWRLINKVASDDLAPDQAAKDMQSFIAGRKS
ncbi:extracellular solute-binding protein [Lichenihabitans psoromatis]|uniref:ABC transporter substrate-binding protein n=1 Tax=Lichenihabitans psoromatis TaxID=2528642 RepID=UPI0010382E7E